MQLQKYNFLENGKFDILEKLVKYINKIKVTIEAESETETEIKNLEEKNISDFSKIIDLIDEFNSKILNFSNTTNYLNIGEGKINEKINYLILEFNESETADLDITESNTAGLKNKESETAGLKTNESNTAGLNNNESETADFFNNESVTADLKNKESETAGLKTNESNTAGLNYNESETADFFNNESVTADLKNKESETAGLKTNESNTAGLNYNESEAADYKYNESETAGLNINESNTAGLNNKESDSADLKNNESETEDFFNNESVTADLNYNESETAGLNINESNTASFNINESNTAGLNNNESDSAGLNINESNTADLNNNTNVKKNLVTLIIFYENLKSLYIQLSNLLEKILKIFINFLENSKNLNNIFSKIYDTDFLLINTAFSTYKFYIEKLSFFLNIIEESIQNENLIVNKIKFNSKQKYNFDNFLKYLNFPTIEQIYYYNNDLSKSFLNLIGDFDITQDLYLKNKLNKSYNKYASVLSYQYKNAQELGVNVFGHTYWNNNPNFYFRLNLNEYNNSILELENCYQIILNRNDYEIQFKLEDAFQRRGEGKSKIEYFKKLIFDNLTDIKKYLFNEFKGITKPEFFFYLCTPNLIYVFLINELHKQNVGNFLYINSNKFFYQKFNENIIKFYFISWMNENLDKIVLKEINSYYTYCRIINFLKMKFIIKGEEIRKKYYINFPYSNFSEFGIWRNKNINKLFDYKLFLIFKHFEIIK